jgi:diguanylate cyclase (GGDEF)-like protein
VKWFALFALGVAILTIGLGALTLRDYAWQPGARDLLAFAVLVAGFTVARRVGIEVDVRRDSVRIGINELPLAVGLLLVPAPVVLGASLAVALTSGLLRRDEWPKLLVNCSMSAVLVEVAALVAHRISGGAGAGEPVWIGVLVGVCVGQLVASVIFLLAIALRGAIGKLRAARIPLHNLLVGAVSSLVGIVATEVVINVRWGWLLVLLFSAALAQGYRSFYALLREQRDLELLAAISLAVTGAGRGSDDQADPADDTIWTPAAEMLREQLNARRVVLHRRLPDGRVRTAVAGEPLPAGAPQDSTAVLEPTGLLDGAAGTVRHVVAPDEEGMRRRGAHEALAVALRGGTELLGALEVHDRRSRLRLFNDADVRLVDMVAAHLSTALDNRRLLARVRHHAYHDALTGMRNRQGFREVLDAALAADTPCTVLVIDLDVLPRVNDALGHTWGDRTVAEAGRRLAEVLPPGVLAARLEGATFAALLIDLDGDEELRLAETVRRCLARPYPVEQLTVEGGAVAGLVRSDVEPASGADVLLQRADVAAQAARTGEAKVRAYAPSMGQIFQRRFQLVTQFQAAIADGQLSVAFQPKVALQTRRLVGVEALVRWQHPEFGALVPDEFVSVVETTGLVDALTSFVLDRSLAKCRDWLDRGLRLGVAVNLSVRSLADEGFPDRVAQALERHDVPPSLLTFELTESAVMEDPERALPVLRHLHRLGIVLAVDDFGTGYSSLAYLRRLPVDEVKIDKSFVLGMGTDLSDLAVVRAIVDLGHSLDLVVVAEGVEEDAVRDQLAEMGCDVAQGYLVSRPLAEERFEAWLRARTVRGPDRPDGADHPHGPDRRQETVLTLLR